MKQIAKHLLKTGKKAYRNFSALFYGTVIFLLVFSCNKPNDAEPIIPDPVIYDSVVIWFNMEKMAEKELPGLDLFTKGAFWTQKRYVYENESSHTHIEIRIGIYASAEVTETMANDWFSNMPLIPNEGEYQGETVGDKFWWWAPSYDSTVLWHVYFIRKNVFFDIFSTNMNLIEFSKQVDQGILHHAEYVGLDTAIQLPVIDTILAFKNIVTIGDTTEITIMGHDPHNEPFVYMSIPVLYKNKDKPENVFYFKASSNYDVDEFGICTLKAVAINESNVVSEIATIGIKLVE